MKYIVRHMENCNKDVIENKYHSIKKYDCRDDAFAAMTLGLRSWLKKYNRYIDHVDVYEDGYRIYYKKIQGEYLPRVIGQQIETLI